ncbi:hypothetical protein PHMEG_00015294 [Phytophthora megakarya]|uniref:Uncharacterized protein n=1 Tax=Phytophthora megakarya TaxID=4795 RepID=A0A225W252_9STRA|nr:hypothetical protein PHMEG_00015294 [Phytophthora megakarya]
MSCSDRLQIRDERNVANHAHRFQFQAKSEESRYRWTRKQLFCWPTSAILLFCMHVSEVTPLFY